MLRSAEGSVALVDRVHTLDLAIDAWVDQVRDRRLDPVFYGLSSAADHGLLWLLDRRAAAPAWQGDPEIALRLGASMGVESVLTNGPIKQCFRRVRPVLEQPRGAAPLRHAPPDHELVPVGPRGVGLHRGDAARRAARHAACFRAGGAVAASRVYMRMHHASDIVAGAALGVALGAIARKVLPLDWAS